MDKQRMELAVRELLIGMGEDPDREDLLETPRRVAEMYEEILADKDVKYTTFSNSGDGEDLVVVKDIHFTTLCEHHLLPFEGTIAYIAKENPTPIIGEALNSFAKDLSITKSKPIGEVKVGDNGEESRMYGTQELIEQIILTLELTKVKKTAYEIDNSVRSLVEALLKHTGSLVILIKMKIDNEEKVYKVDNTGVLRVK